MKNDYILFNIFKNKGLLSGFIISIFTHFFLFTLFPIKENKLLGDKYIPIEILDIKSPLIKGDSINESNKVIKKNLSNKENNFKKNSEEKLEKEIDDKKFEDFKKDSKNNNVQESLLKTTSQNSQLENENKIRGTEKGIKSNTTEAGSIQGKGYQKVTCLKCIEPKYPKLALKRGYEGILKLEITILKSGKVKEVFIKESTGFEILDKAGVNAALNSTFYPLSRRTNLKIEYTLRLD